MSDEMGRTQEELLMWMYNVAIARDDLKGKHRTVNLKFSTATLRMWIQRVEDSANEAEMAEDADRWRVFRDRIANEAIGVAGWTSDVPLGIALPSLPHGTRLTAAALDTAASDLHQAAKQSITPTHGLRGYP